MLAFAGPIYVNVDRDSYDAVIGISCGSTSPDTYIKQHPNRYCVLHVDKAIAKLENETVQRGCWLNSMHECFFHPVELPQFPYSKCAPTGYPLNGLNLSIMQGGVDNNTKFNNVNICISGGSGGRKETFLHHALDKISFKNIELSFYGRFVSDENVQAKIINEYGSLVDELHLERHRDFLSYHYAISQCDVLLPLLTPETTGGYFPPPQNAGKQSGCMGQVLGYEVPVIIHRKHHEIYGPFLTAPSASYSNGDEFVDALQNMVFMLHRTLPEQKQTMCRGIGQDLWNKTVLPGRLVEWREERP